MSVKNEAATQTSATQTVDFPSDHELVITRVLNAPRELVWQAWTEREALAKWWGPIHSDNEVVKLDLREGGIFHYRMDFPDGKVIWGKFIYREIVAPERLVHVDSFCDENENITRAPFSEKFPLEILNTLTLTEENGKTHLTLRGVPINATPEEEEFLPPCKLPWNKALAEHSTNSWNIWRKPTGILPVGFCFEVLEFDFFDVGNQHFRHVAGVLRLRRHLQHLPLLVII